MSILNNTNKLQSLLGKINALPEVENLDEDLVIQNELIEQILTVLTEKGYIVNIITFTVADYRDNTNKQYQAEEGMTWQEWINSEYNTDDYMYDEDLNEIIGSDLSVQINANIDDIIIDTYNYATSSSSIF